jgi:hypothetical protein
MGFFVAVFAHGILRVGVKKIQTQIIASSLAFKPLAQPSPKPFAQPEKRVQ